MSLVANKTTYRFFFFDGIQAEVLCAGYIWCFFPPQRLPVSQSGGETHSDTGLQSIRGEDGGLPV